MIALSNQSFFDIALQTTGIAENAVAIADANGYDVIDIPEPGENIIIPAALEVNAVVVSALAVRSLATGTEYVPDGIGGWYIGSTFIVS
jgi:hypothetical protein